MSCVRCGASAVAFIPGRRLCRRCHRLASRRAYFRSRFVRLEQMARYRAVKYGCEVIHKLDYSLIYETWIGCPCSVCGCILDANSPLDFHHINDLSLGGLHTYDNVVLVHRSCNRGLAYRMFILATLGR